jgi:hypothetical protein
MAYDDTDNDRGRWLPVSEAAEKLGITENNLRTKMSRRSVRSRKGNDGRVQAWVADDLTEDDTDHHTPSESPPAPPEAHLPASVVDEIRRGYEGRIDDLKAVAVELADRGTAEIERMQVSHREEMDRLGKAYGSEIDDLRLRLDEARKTEGDVREVLLELLKVMGERK